MVSVDISAANFTQRVTVFSVAQTSCVPLFEGTSVTKLERLPINFPSNSHFTGVSVGAFARVAISVSFIIIIVALVLWLGGLHAVFLVL